MKGPAILLAQFLRDEPPYDNLENIGRWVAGLGYKGVQIPTWDPRVIDLDKVAESKAYADDYLGGLADLGLEVTELASHLQGQVLAMHPAYADGFSVFHPPGLSGSEVTEWATDQLGKSIKASANLGVNALPVMSGGFAWHMIYPWPQRPPGVIETAFEELARRWRPILDMASDHGVTIAYELHPGSDLYDGATFEMFLDATDNHEAACINYDPSHFHPPAAGLPGLHPPLRRPHHRLPRQGRRVPARRPRGRLRRLPGLDRSRRALPVTGRRPGGLHAGVHPAHRGRLPKLGGTGVGVLRQEPRAGRGRRRALHRAAPDRRRRRGI